MIYFKHSLSWFKVDHKFQILSVEIPTWRQRWHHTPISTRTHFQAFRIKKTYIFICHHSLLKCFLSHSLFYLPSATSLLQKIRKYQRTYLHLRRKRRMQKKNEEKNATLIESAINSNCYQLILIKFWFMIIYLSFLNKI